MVIALLFVLMREIKMKNFVVGLLLSLLLSVLVGKIGY